MSAAKPRPAAKPKPAPRDAAALAASRGYSLEGFESLCSQCGKCCYKKIRVGKTVFITPFPCEYLDTERNRCTIYEQRHLLNPDCLDIEEGMAHNAFPADCTYVPEFAPAGYRPALDTWSWVDEWSDFDDLADQLEVSEQTREKIRARGPFAPPLWVEAQARIQSAKHAAPPGVSPPVVAEAKPVEGSEERR